MTIKKLIPCASADGIIRRLEKALFLRDDRNRKRDHRPPFFGDLALRSPDADVLVGFAIGDGYLPDLWNGSGVIAFFKELRFLRGGDIARGSSNDGSMCEGCPRPA